MRRPGPATLSRWYAAQPERDYTCSDCGKVGPKWAVQPQHPYYADGLEGVARCVDCIAAINRRMREERKAQLAAMPRCEVDGCKARATYTVAGVVRMCGRHVRKAEARAAGFGWLAMAMDYDAATIKSLAQ